MKLIIGNKNYSSWSLRPWLLLKHFNVSFEEHFIALFTDDMQKNMKQYCPNNKVPVLIDNSENIWDSLAICEFINEKYLENKAWPQDLTQRALARAACAEMHSSFFSMRDEMPMNCRRIPSKLSLSENTLADIERVKALWLSCLSQHQGKFLFDQFSIADAFFMPVIIRFSIYKIEVPTEIGAYMQTMLSLPAYQQWLREAKQEQQIIEYAEV